MTDWNKLTVANLKTELKRRDLPQTGLKAALVDRLIAADTEAGFESEATLQEDGPKLQEPRSSPEAQARPVVAINDVVDEPILEPPETLKSDVPLPESTEISLNVPEEGISNAQVHVSTPDVPTSTTQNGATFSPPTTESKDIIEDKQKRKRRSQSPPPSAMGTPRKRLRQNEHSPVTKTDEEHAENKATHSGEDVDNTKENVETNPAATDEAVTSHVVIEAHTSLYESGQSPKHKDSRFNHLFNGQPQDAQESASLEQMEVDDPEPERTVSPAIHPATSSLYIRDFMRPLNAGQLKDYLTTLATPPGLTFNPEVISEFYLDSIRTHAFVTFKNISAASRVRSELHDRIWPEERTRKPLWVDFIPSENVLDWIDEEKASGGSRSSAKKWEVAYIVDVDRNVTVSLQETGAIPALSVKPSLAAAVPDFGRKPSVASSPNVDLPRPGVIGAPSGPRAQRDDARVSRGSVNNIEINPLSKYTIAIPAVAYQPVSKALADQRLHQLKSATSKKPYTKAEINRYTFEAGDRLVDRGPEIFSSIRPPPGYRGRGGSRGGFRGRGPPRFDDRRGKDQEFRGGRNFGGSGSYRGGRDFGSRDSGSRNFGGGRDFRGGGDFRGGRDFDRRY